MPPKTGKRAVDEGAPSPTPTRVQPARGLGANQQHLESLGTAHSSPGASPENAKEQEEIDISTASASPAGVDMPTDAHAPPAANNAEPNTAPPAATTTNAPSSATSAPSSATSAPSSATSASVDATNAPPGATTNNTNNVPAHATSASEHASSAPENATNAPEGAPTSQAPQSAPTSNASEHASNAPEDATNAPAGAPTTPRAPAPDPLQALAAHWNSVHNQRESIDFHSTFDNDNRDLFSTPTRDPPPTLDSRPTTSPSVLKLQGQLRTLATKLLLSKHARSLQVCGLSGTACPPLQELAPHLESADLPTLLAAVTNIKAAIKARDAADLQLCTDYSDRMCADDDSDEEVLLQHQRPPRANNNTQPPPGDPPPPPTTEVAPPPACTPIATSIDISTDELSVYMQGSIGKLHTNPSKPLLQASKAVIKAIVSSEGNSLAAVETATKEMYHVAVDGMGLTPSLAGWHTLHYAAFNSGLNLNGTGNNKQVVTLTPTGSVTLDGASSSSRMMTPSGSLAPTQGPPFRHLDSNTSPKKREKDRAAAHQELIDGHKFVAKAPVDAEGVRTINISASLNEKLMRRQIVQHNIAVALATAISALYQLALKNAATGPYLDRLQTLDDRVTRFLELGPQPFVPVNEELTPITLILSSVVAGSNAGSIILAMAKDAFRDEHHLDFFGSFGSILLETPITTTETPSAYLTRIIDLAKRGKQLRSPFPLPTHGIACDTNGAPLLFSAQFVVQTVVHELAFRRTIEHGCYDVLHFITTDITNQANAGTLTLAALEAAIRKMSTSGGEITPPADHAPQSGAFSSITQKRPRIPKTPPPDASYPSDGKGGRGGGKGGGKGDGKGGGKGGGKGKGDGKGGKGGRSQPSTKLKVYSQTVDNFILNPDSKKAFSTLANALNRTFDNEYHTPLFVSTTNKNPSVIIPLAFSPESNCSWWQCKQPDGEPVNDQIWATFKFLADIQGIHVHDLDHNGLTSMGYHYNEKALARTPPFDWSTQVQTFRAKVTGVAAPKSYKALNAHTAEVQFEEEEEDDEYDDEEDE